jgi:polysaccharide pyruvyl transferase WcaK-like protein
MKSPSQRRNEGASVLNIFLANDTSSSNHAGCKAVMRSLRKLISELPETKIVGRSDHSAKTVISSEFDEADLILINGEGTIHHSSPRAQFLLNLILRAKQASKKVVLVNALFQQYECPSSDLLQDLTFLAVREPRSAAYARRFGGSPLVLLDSAADPQFLLQGQALPLHHGCVIGGFHEKGLLYDPFGGMKGQKLTMRNNSFEDIVATLRTAEVYLTAQHHGVYAAALAGCPFVATPSNSHKIEGFIEWTGLPIPICMNIREVSSAVQYAIRNRSMYSELAAFFESQSVLTSTILADAIR